MYLVINNTPNLKRKTQKVVGIFKTRRGAFKVRARIAEYHPELQLEVIRKRWYWKEQLGRDLIQLAQDLREARYRRLCNKLDRLEKKVRSYHKKA